MESQIMDMRDAPDAILVPACTEQEVPLETVKDASTFTRVEGSRYFPIDFRMRRLIIDAVAQKYQSSADAAEDGGDIVCIGETRCERAWESGAPELAATATQLRTARGSTEGIVAIHLLGHGQPQPFLALGKRYAFLCTEETGDVLRLSYAEMRLTPDGLTTTSRLHSEEPLLIYPLAESFRAFFREFVLLRRTSMTNIHARHPLADIAFESRIRYLDFLVDASAAEGRLTAQSAIRLEYMAREFHVGADNLAKSFEKAAAGGIPEAEMYDRLAQLILKDLQSWEIFVLYQDILSLIVETDGGNCRPCLYRLLQRKALAGGAFVAACADAIRYRRQAVQCMEAAVSSIDGDCRSIYWPNLQQMQRYDEDTLLKLMELQREDCHGNLMELQRYEKECRLKMMDIGVMTDDGTR
ncbi:MAG: hypothetical protein SPL62_04365 [Selenomonas sp.]|nr:hypothetical protein [Selenomonas sp.]